MRYQVQKQFTVIFKAFVYSVVSKLPCTIAEKCRKYWILIHDTNWTNWQFLFCIQIYTANKIFSEYMKREIKRLGLFEINSLRMSSAWWFNWQYSLVLSPTKNWHLSPTYKLWPATFCPRIFTFSWHLLNYWKLKLNLIITWNLGSQLKSQHIHFEQQFLFYANFVSI